MRYYLRHLTEETMENYEKTSNDNYSPGQDLIPRPFN
jgi:hypothetical protein